MYVFGYVMFVKESIVKYVTWVIAKVYCNDVKIGAITAGKEAIAEINEAIAKVNGAFNS